MSNGKIQLHFHPRFHKKIVDDMNKLIQVRAYSNRNHLVEVAVIHLIEGHYRDAERAAKEVKT